MKIKNPLLSSLLCFFAPFLLWADFGVHSIQDSYLSVDLNDPSVQVSFRFTCGQDMDLVGASFFCGDVKGSPSLELSLHEDRNGRPNENDLGNNRIVPKTSSWNTVPLDHIPLIAGRTYHLVLRPDRMRGGHHPVSPVDTDHHASIVYGNLLNPIDPQGETTDKKLNVLVLTKDKWRTTDHQPLYALSGSGGRAQGNPYDLIGQRPVHGNGTPNDPSDDLLQSECLHPHYGMNATGIMVRVRKQGNPSAPLNYQVYVNQFQQHTTLLAFKGKAFDPGKVKKDFEWLSFPFAKEDHPQSFPPECRYIVFQTDSGRASTGSPGCEDCYVISDLGTSPGLPYGEDLTFDGGAHLSRAAFSADGGKTWIDEFARDANVVLVGPESPIPSLAPPGPIPTPGLLMKGWEP